MIAARWLKMRPTLLAFAAGYAAILCLNWQALEQPPAWDAAMSVHPAAITLSKNGFNLSELLGQPTYHQGGPNTHAASSITCLFAAIYWLLGDSAALYPLMHLLEFSIAAAGIAAAFQLARPLLGDALTYLFCAAVLTCPAFLAQAGCLYLEIPLLTCTIGALTAWASGRRGMAAFLAVLACSVKETGFAAAAALGVAALLERGAWKSRLVGAGGILAPAATTVLVKMSVVRPAVAVDYRQPELAYFLRYHVAERIVQAPDLCCFLVLFMLASAWQCRREWRSLRAIGFSNADRPNAEAPQFGLACLVAWALLGILAATPLVGELYVLPRYFVQILPCVLLVLVDSLRRMAGARAACAATALAAMVFLANRYGALYPENPVNDGAVAERSLEYGDLLEAQRMAIKSLEKLPADMPIFYGYPEHFMSGYPEMRFVERRPANGHCIFLQAPYRNGRLADFPERFYVLVDYGALGGRQIQSLVLQAARAGWRVKKAADVRRGRYRVMLVELRAR